MDRLFLSLLVREIASAVSGRRVRSIAAASERQGVVLSLSPPGPRELVVSLDPRAPGLFLGDPPWPTRPAPPALRKRLSGAALGRMRAAPLDRSVCLEAEHTRLSGRTSRLELRLEIAGNRTDLFLLERPDGVVLDAVSSGRARAHAGERWVEREPPPGARPPAADAEELERRLRDQGVGAGDRPGRRQLLDASGLTPLLVDELSWHLDRGASPAEAFRDVQRALASPRATLLVREAGGRAERERRVRFAPFPLRSAEDAADVRGVATESFNEAMREGARLAEESRRAGTIHRELAKGVSQRSSRLGSLHDRLQRDLESVPDPAEARRHGERLLAAHGSARRSRSGYVVLPDPFDEKGNDVEVPVDPRLGLVANAERWFRRSRKAERKLVAVEERLRAVAAELEYLDHLRVAIEDASSVPELESLFEDVRSEGVVPLPRARTEDRSKKAAAAGARGRLPPRRFATSSGRTVLVGRSARSNEELTFHIAQPSDLWFHASGRAGAHVVLRVPEGVEPEPEEIAQAAGLAAYFSKARNDSYVEVLVTERRHVRKLRGAPPGTVRVEGARSIRVPPLLLEPGVK